MKVLLLSRYDRLGASSRLRTVQYLPALAAAGIEVTVAPLFSNEYLRELYAGRRTWGSVAQGFFRRIKQLRSAGSVDLIWLEKEVFPWLPWSIERTLLGSGVPIVSDYDDAVFHRYDLHRVAPVRWILGNKIDRVMAASTLVVAGNGYLAARAKTAGAHRVEVVPTVVDTAVYQLSSPKPEGASLAVGWIGTPSTWTAYVEPLRPTLTKIVSASDTILRAVGAGPAAKPHSQLEVVDWSEDREVELIQDMDIGIMPLNDTPWSSGKCGYKLIQYMACGLPVVASPVGVNIEIVEHGVNGFLAETDFEWREALTRLLGDAELRRRMGAAGRQKVETHYSLQAYAPLVAQLLRGAAQENRRHR